MQDPNSQSSLSFTKFWSLVFIVPILNEIQPNKNSTNYKELCRHPDNVSGRSIHFFEKFKDLESLYLGKCEGNCPIARHLCYHKYLLFTSAWILRAYHTFSIQVTNIWQVVTLLILMLESPLFFFSGFYSGSWALNRTAVLKRHTKEETENRWTASVSFFFINLIPYLTVL